MDTIFDILILIFRVALPIALALLFLSLLHSCLKKAQRISLARLCIRGTQNSFEIKGRECSLGRSKICDVRLNIPSISRRHAVLNFSEDYGFRISTVNDSEIYINGIRVDGFAYLQQGDVIEIGGVEITVEPPLYDDLTSNSKSKRNKGTFLQMLLLSVSQVIVLSELLIHYSDESVLSIPLVFIGLMAIEWVYYLIFHSSENMHVEIIGFLLTTFGFAVAASAMPSSLVKQFISFLLGLFIFIACRYILRNIELTMKLRYVLAVATFALFAVNLLFGKNINGAKNWIAIGGVTVQPSELLKFAFIFVGASTLDRLLAKRNVILFLVYAGGCLGALALMKDFGTAAIYFATALVIMFMRSGDIKIITAVTAAVGVAAVLVANFVPYVHNRFATYRHAWEYASDKGYQQTRTMMAIGSGGLFGVGGGEGNLDNVAASDTDLVFGILCEEWGIIAAVALVMCFVLLALYTWRRIPAANSSFYAIAACAATSLYIVQISLNIFGSTDLLPLTGVTMPFISNGGSSMMASFALLSFVKAVGENCNKPEYINDGGYDGYYDEYDYDYEGVDA